MGQPHSQTTRGSQPPRPHRLQVLQDQMLQTSWDMVKDESSPASLLISTLNSYAGVRSRLSKLQKVAQ